MPVRSVSASRRAALGYGTCPGSTDQEMARVLEATGDVRFMRRLPPLAPEPATGSLDA